MNEDCQTVSCPVPNDAVQDFANQYSLENVVVKNDPFSAIINFVPIVIPQGTITVPVNPGGSFVTYQGCQAPISLPIPVGSTTAQIQAIAQQVANLAAQQLAQCKAAKISSPPPPHFVNEQVSFATACTDAAPLTITGTLPAGMTQNGNSVVLAAGVFGSSVSQADADNSALTYLTNFITNLFSTGGASCLSGCVDSQILTTTTADFITPGNLNTVNITVADSSLFVADSVTGYWLIRSMWDNTAMAFVVTSIVDPHTIAVTQLSRYLDIGAGQTVASGASIYLSPYHGRVTTPPVVTSVSVQNYSTQLLPYLDAACGSCLGAATVWDGSFPHLDLAFGGFNEFGYEQGSYFGFTDQQINSNALTSFQVDIFYSDVAGSGSSYNLGYWEMLLECHGTQVFRAVKFGGVDATGVYYINPGFCLYPAFNSKRCLVVT